MDNIKIRIFKEHNYKGIFCNGKTMRIPLNKKIPITELEYPEFFDVKITDKCYGECSYCYQDSKPQDRHFDNIENKINSFFGAMTKNQRPFQVALGGGNPNEHPDFVKILAAFNNLEIMPNYTTNGMGITEEILKVTQRYCGGVAVSCHPHLKRIWENAADIFIEHKIRLNFHVIVSDKQSVVDFVELFNTYRDKVDYFVLLPHIVKGRATLLPAVGSDYLVSELIKLDNSKLAFGANFYKFLKDYKKWFDVSLYEPEIFSKYLDMDDMSLYPSSFDC